MDIDLRPLLQAFAGEEAVDAVRRDRAVADRRGEEMRPDDVAAGEGPRLAGDLVALVRGDGALADVEFLEAREIDRLPDRGDDEIGGDFLLGAFAAP